MHHTLGCSALLLLALASAHALRPPHAHAQPSPPGATFFSARSGAWHEPDLWTLRDGQDADGLPDADDKVFIQATHAVTFQGQDAQPSALEINLYGSLRLLHDDQQRPARLWAYRVLVRGGGALSMLGPHTLTLTGGEQSLLAVKTGGALDLRGASTVERSRVTAVVSEDERALVLRDASQAWTPGALRGHTLKLLDGRARLWSLQVTDNTRDTLTLALGSLGSPPGRPTFEARPDPDDRRALWTAPDLLDLKARPLEDALWRGRWLRWTDRQGQPQRSWVYGLEDRDPGAQDRLLVWPPIPSDAPDPLRLTPTMGVEPGDAYTLYAPAHVTVPAASQLPNRPASPWGISVLVEPRTRATLSRASLGYGFLHLVRVDLTDPDTAFEADLLDIHDADPPCYLYAQEARGLRLRRLHARDVHPDSDTREFGGRWEPDQQRGHGFCLYGDDLSLEDSLASNLNDDLFYVARARGVTLRGNVALNSGVRHGNSLEGISLFDLDGPATLDQNISLGTPTPLRLERRSPAAAVTLQGNVLAQDQHQALLLDLGPADAGPLTLTDALLLGGAERPALVRATSPLALSRTVAARVQARGPVRLTASAWLDPGRDERPMLQDPAQVLDSLLSKPRLTASGALLYVQAPDASPHVARCTLHPGQGGALRHASTSDLPARYERNLSLGPLLTGPASDPKPANPDLSLAWNLALGPLTARAPWLAAHLGPSNQTTDRLTWANPARYEISPDDPSTRAALGAPIGLSSLLGPDDDALPLPLHPDRWHDLLPLPPTTTPDPAHNNSTPTNNGGTPNNSADNSADNNADNNGADNPNNSANNTPKPADPDPDEVTPSVTRPVAATCAACAHPSPRPPAAPWVALLALLSLATRRTRP